MKKYLLILFATVLIGCKPSVNKPIDVKNDTIENVKDSVVVTPPAKDTIVVPVEDVYKTLFVEKKKDYTKSKKINDSLRTVNVKLNFELDQHIKNQAEARAYVNKAVANKANDKYLKGWMISTVNKPVTKYKGGDIVTESIKVDSLLQPKEKFNLYSKETRKLDSLNIVFIDKNLVDAKQLLHKKFVTTNAQFYLNITIKNPSQDKFLKGWMRRALSQ